ARIPVFHWMLEFPEVFYAERPDPLEGGTVNRAAFMDAFIGNPPFAGKDAVAAANGLVYSDWLRVTFEGDRGVRGNCDLSAFFFRRVTSVVGAHGTRGVLATTSVAQGDPGTLGLPHLLVEEGAMIQEGPRSRTWRGEAAVTAAVVQPAKGRPTAHAGQLRL